MQDLEKLCVFIFTFPGKLKAHLAIIFKICRVTVDDNGIVYLCSQAREKFYIVLVLLLNYTHT